MESDLSAHFDSLEMREAARKAADVNWSHSVSRVRTRPRSSEGSLYNVDERPAYRSTILDWTLGLAVLGGLMATVYEYRHPEASQMIDLLLAASVGAMVGTVVGALIYALSGWKRRVDRRR